MLYLMQIMVRTEQLIARSGFAAQPVPENAGDSPEERSLCLPDSGVRCGVLPDLKSDAQRKGRSKNEKEK